MRKRTSQTLAVASRARRGRSGVTRIRSSWTLVAAVGSLVSGCQTLEIDPSHDRSAVELAELRARARRSPPVIQTDHTPPWTRATALEITADSAIWRDDLGRRMALSIRQLEAVRFERRTAAAVSGATAGASAGALIGYARADGPEWWRERSVYAGALIGGIVGAAVGRMFGLPITYRFR